jgi:hypothetical protein
MISLRETRDEGLAPARGRHSVSCSPHVRLAFHGPLGSIVGACVIATWACGLIRSTAAIRLDMNPDRDLAGRLRQAIESQGNQLAGLIFGAWAPGTFGPSSRW